jgi:hypothetical protein
MSKDADLKGDNLAPQPSFIISPVSIIGLNAGIENPFFHPGAIFLI